MPYEKCSCGKKPSFNVFGETKPICCKTCKTDDMIDIVSKKCPCGARASFNVPGQSSGVCCSKCKTDDMINVNHKRCPCGNYPIYNIPGHTQRLCCSKCKTDGMINVVNKRCSCGNYPIYNVSGETNPVCCMKCKTGDMVNVMVKKCSCGKISNFNVPWETKGICCSKCKTDKMVDVVSKICPGYSGECPVRTYITNGHKYCISCDPNDARRKLFKRFEETFFEYVKGKLDVHQREFRVKFDQNETAKKFARLDGIVIVDGVIVCLEVDENGHHDYECDEHRMHLVTAELLKSYPGYVVSWVRVNPTVGAKSQWSKTSKKIREKLFEDAVNSVKDILKMRDTRIVYIGTYDM